jgi:hypothetical protein
MTQVYDRECKLLALSCDPAISSPNSWPAVSRLWTPELCGATRPILLSGPPRACRGNEQEGATKPSSNGTSTSAIASRPRRVWPSGTPALARRPSRGLLALPTVAGTVVSTDLRQSTALRGQTRRRAERRPVEAGHEPLPARCISGKTSPSLGEESLVVVGGGAGNRTRVLRCEIRASPGAACNRFSQPQRSRKQAADRLSRCEISQPIPRPDRLVEPSC